MKCENCENYEYCMTYGTECYEIEDECAQGCENCHYKDYCSTDWSKPNISENKNKVVEVIWVNNQ